MNFDIFNGDADGICALHQLRLVEPRSAELITGVKRDISLVQNALVKAGDDMVILDVSLDKNRSALEEALKQDVKITYYDHHFAGEIPDNNQLTCFIDTSAEICTSLIVNQQLGGKHVMWAITAAFGDNLHKPAVALANEVGLNENQAQQLEELGTLINYNGYGLTIDDLYFPPDELYKIIHQYENPFDFIENESAFNVLKTGYYSDLEKAKLAKADIMTEKQAIYILPNEPWSRRIAGVYGNILTRQTTNRAHAILTEVENNNYMVSVRAPLNNRDGADKLCRQFKTGGGRKAAAGINALPFVNYPEFVEKFKLQFQ